MSSMDIDGIYKNAKLVASDTPYLKPLSDEQIVFYNLDVNTAILTFQVKKDKYPLQISSLNSDIDLYVESENGSHTSLTKVEYIDSLNGIIRFVIDRDFLKASTDTWVNGQVRVKAVGRPDTVILNEFRFYVKDALINKIGADIKVRYIRQIDDLIEEAEKRLIAASAGIENVESIQLSFNSFISEQKQDLEKIVTDTERRTNNLVDSAQKDINSAIQNMRDEADTIRKNLSDETAGAITKSDLDSTLSNYVTTVDFNNALNNKADKGQVAPSNLPDNFNELINQAVTNRISELNQNKALFNNNGEVYEINNPDLSTMDFVDKSGYFYAVGPLHTPDGNDTEGMLQILAYGNYTKVIYSPNEINAIYLRSKLNQVGNNWTDWLNIGSEVEIGTNDSYVEENDVDTSIDDSTETT
ncbi:BppU family phage baseplate upper protein [Staphylococcus haemolyticus]|uniref:BppU family phage baseplate upper protein n=1 Tax=Staphylococcus haemolyticus TaxID=1283 RepID=UPI0028A48E49|nr:BppU family phage baseplate upper protein [Staphylococcus haemolyticus]MDT4239005.1 BppU family phage baseplate upper protein [Staphylococcus haemolyticus]MDT4297468.1 BppU family phage baseplate upper protein [Staphylococcus haemolyticus]MDT4301188.1 BppU family phage baseplate upper protein [Staphylococcus haemolyticus]MDT4312047.1 BppU family phage baseplate upper protein [Staphylococcus haemolyticus]MDT4316715.1 BppU family phage baseplate upper protein [Staphylococcus haemolyticus]